MPLIWWNQNNTQDKKCLSFWLMNNSAITLTCCCIDDDTSLGLALIISEHTLIMLSRPSLCVREILAIFGQQKKTIERKKTDFQ